MKSDGLIDDVVAGDDFEVVRTITDVTDGLTLAEAWFMVKRDASDDDLNAIITKHITTLALAGAGQITDDGADGTGVALFQLSRVETALIDPKQTFVFGVRAALSDGAARTVELGIIRALPPVGGS